MKWILDISLPIIILYCIILYYYISPIERPFPPQPFFPTSSTSTSMFLYVSDTACLTRVMNISTDGRLLRHVKYQWLYHWEKRYSPSPDTINYFFRYSFLLPCQNADQLDDVAVTTVRVCSWAHWPHHTQKTLFHSTPPQRAALLSFPPPLLQGSLSCSRDVWYRCPA